ncbi:MAG: hypothetical protein GOMPHAMPRED_008244 [Gomphillus americanus]|uniref:3-hydroxyanthranilate 3,4-dioxygenase n=1 Tax=Gomphillus americanus TaxID=1940652 RepID=A0A8H3I4J2_9LECA|nr:MAG: hypothetical protein GOMPHAMPRED_008244 [Gomphillus americanus]
MTIMIVGGPNARTDYHINPTPELFFQYRGSMLLRVVDPVLAKSGDGEPEAEASFKDIAIREGDVFLLPGGTPHNPIRFEDTVGLVVELSRPGGVSDGLRWYCQVCRRVVFETQVADLGEGLKGAVKAFAESEERRRCGGCGTLCDVVPAGVVQP